MVHALSCAPSARRAFTLIELLVVIAIIALLLGILFPALGSARRSGWQTKSLANARTVQVAFQQYADEARNYPFRAPGDSPGPDYEGVVPEDVLLVQWWPGTAYIGTSDHFEHAHLWPSILMPMDSWPEHYPTWVSPGFSTELPTIEDFFSDEQILPRALVSMRYSNSFVADPRLWPTDPDAESSSDRSLLRAVRPGEVRYPASKVMVWDGHLAYIRPEPEVVGGHYDARTPMAFADGHGALHKPQDATAPAPNTLREPGEAPMTLHDTPGGVAGVDY